MPKCEQCGAVYLSVLGACPKCGPEETVKEYTSDTECVAPLTEAEQKRLRIKSWIEICAGVPALIGLIYGIIYLIKLFGGT